MKRKTTIAVACILISILSSCTNNMFHTWNIEEYEIIRENKKNSNYSNIGTLTFKKDGNGNANYQLIENNFTDQSSFKWEMVNGNLQIKPNDKNLNSIVAKVWILVEDKAKHKTLKSTDGKYEVQILKLSRN